MAGREGAITVSDKVESGETDGPQVTVVVHPLVLLSTVDHYTRRQGHEEARRWSAPRHAE